MRVSNSYSYDAQEITVTWGHELRCNLNWMQCACCWHQIHDPHWWLSVSNWVGLIYGWMSVGDELLLRFSKLHECLPVCLTLRWHKTLCSFTFISESVELALQLHHCLLYVGKNMYSSTKYDVQTLNPIIILCMLLPYIIRESVDSLCRDGADVQYMQYLRKSRIISPQER